jgi:hypothetical protein
MVIGIISQKLLLLLFLLLPIVGVVKLAAAPVLSVTTLKLRLVGKI